ncbi:hypothetical protein [Phenylobacterium sp.]|uniref:hypothetical protein n=1 Tax=Phenylobacterium sp. TaxID=1871053 RepID=UPI0025D89EF6|nr:hypothetical protein [Phenylobacterium sp.]
MRRLIATAAARLGRRAPAPQLHTDHAIAARAFDAAFYLKFNPDVAANGGDPLDHFMAFGWREGRDPTPDFSVRAYLAAFPEVAASDANPFVHYLASGRPRVLAPEPVLGFRHELIERLVPMETRIAVAMTGEVAAGSQADLSAALATSRDGLRRLHVTFSHDDYTAHVGGLQLAIQREAARLAELGRDHLHLHPAGPWPVVRTADDPALLGVIWNGKAVGFFPATAVADGLAGAGQPVARTFAIHSLLGHTADETADILAAAGLNEGVFWLHDFASVCAGFHLLRNDVEDCAAPPPDSAACGICLYGPWRGRQMAGHARLFERLALTVAAPSQVTLDLWTRAAGLPGAATVVLPHAVLTPRGPAPIPASPRPLRIAFAGLPAAHKGWPIFQALASRFADDPRYEFLHLGARRDPAAPARFTQVAVTAANPLAMQEALEAAEVDVVLLWSLCRETFSFVAHEAAAAGCAVLTGPDSGNIAAFVAQTGHGRVLAGEAALRAAFETGELLDLARAQRRPMLYDLAFSALTLDLSS